MKHNNMYCMSFFIRATIYLPSGWPFVFMCAVLRFMEGIGIALFSTGAFYLLVQLYPDSVGLMMVCDTMCILYLLFVNIAILDTVQQVSMYHPSGQYAVLFTELKQPIIL